MKHLSDPDLFRQAAYVNGRWITSPETTSVHDPATREVIGSTPKLGADAISAGIAAAEAAFPAWKRRPAAERADLLRAWYELLLKHRDDLARIMTREQGKPLAEAAGEITYGAGFLRWFSAEAERAYGDVIPVAKAGEHVVVLKQPIGVAAAITPWNFPNAMIARKAAAALAAGCTFIVRPASSTPFSALALAELAERAGIPAGVFNVVTGDSRVVAKVLTGDERVRKLSFTGSTEVGRELLAACAASVKRVSMELGGNAPFIVFDDADLDAAVLGLIASKYRNTGQTCVCANRVFVQAGVYGAFAEKLAAAVAKLKVGNGLEPGVEQGPLIDDDALAKVEEHLADALKKGAKVIQGGQRHALGGTFFQPTVLTGATADMQFMREETFGPLAALLKFESEEEALNLANDTPYGLAAYFYTRDQARAWRVAEGIESGMVGINTGLISNPAAPFGGVKQSGLGREGSHYGLDEYLEIKYLAWGK